MRLSRDGEAPVIVVAKRHPPRLQQRPSMRFSGTEADASLYQLS